MIVISTRLVVPVLRNTETMSFKDIELKISEYAQKVNRHLSALQVTKFSSQAKQGSLSIEEMSGGTFTISNGGIFGSLMSTPILNMPQSAILGMHATKMRAVVVDVRTAFHDFAFTLKIFSGAGSCKTYDVSSFIVRSSTH